MNKQKEIALFCINDTGEKTAAYIGEKDPRCRILGKKKAQSTRELIGQLFRDYTGIVFFCAVGIAVRLCAPFITSKHRDPAVVVVDNGCRHVISLLSGHEGGANNLAYHIAGLIGAEPVITTATEAGKSYTLGIGAIAGIQKDCVIKTVTEILEEVEIPCHEVRIAATIPRKYNEPGIRQAMDALGVGLIRIEEVRIAALGPAFRETAAARYLDIPAVAEPCALLAARDGKILVPVRKLNGITIAIARERIGPV
jgi:cobalamin biosynthesis protein CbiG